MAGGHFHTQLEIVCVGIDFPFGASFWMVVEFTIELRSW